MIFLFSFNKNTPGYLLKSELCVEVKFSLILSEIFDESV